MRAALAQQMFGMRFGDSASKNSAQKLVLLERVFASETLNLPAGEKDGV
jgi:hypothetical protein